MMNSAAFAAQLAERARSGVHAVAQSIAFWTKVTATSADGSADGFEGWPGDGGDPTPQQTNRRGEPWGLHGRPLAGIYELIVRVLAGGTNAISAGFWTGGHGRQNLSEGETQLYCGTDGTEIYLDKNGKMQINAATSQDIAVNVLATGKITINCAAGGTVLVNGNGITDQQVALATVDTAGPYPIIAAAPRRFKAGVT